MSLEPSPAVGDVPRAGTPEAEAFIIASWDFDDPEASAKRFADLAAGCGDPVTAALLRTQQARAVGLAGDLAAAATLLAALRPSPPVDQHLIARHAIETGRVLNSSGDPVGAEPFFAAARRYAEAAERIGGPTP